jgi:hypothetical protein
MVGIVVGTTAEEIRLHPASKLASQTAINTNLLYIFSLGGLLLRHGSLNTAGVY